MNEWILCKNEMPLINVPLMCKTDDGHVFSGHLHKEKSGHTSWLCNDYLHVFNVVAWKYKDKKA